MSEDKKGIRTFVKRFVNPILRNFARLSFGPFALLRHVGRRSGKKYEIPIMVWPVEGGFVIELTYGRKVDWLRNLQAAGGGAVVRHGRRLTVSTPVVLPADQVGPQVSAFWRRSTRPYGISSWVRLRTTDEVPAPAG